MLMLTLSLAGYLRAGTGTNILVTAVESVGEGTTVYTIPHEKAAAQPIWTPEAPAQPPLSIQRACFLARQALANRGKQPVDWRINECALRQFLDGAYQDRWFYAVEFFRPKSARAADRPSDFIQHVILLMDGTVVESSPNPR